MSSVKSRHVPSVSLGLPAYNGAKYIREALDSVVAQTFTDFELVISDNASTDATADICREYARQDERIRYVRQASNIGGLANFRFVLSQATAEYFTWIAHDDLLLPDFVGASYRFLCAHPSVVAVSGDFGVLDENGQVVAKKTLEQIRGDIPWTVRAREFYRYPISNVFFVVYGLMRKDALILALSGARKGPLMAGSELPLIGRLATRGEIASIPRVLRAYRYHDESTFHLELANLAKKPLRGLVLKAYNVWWKRCDQLLVLLRSDFEWRQKLYILAMNSGFYLRCLVYQFLRVPRWVARRLYKSISTCLSIL